MPPYSLTCYACEGKLGVRVTPHWKVLGFQFCKSCYNDKDCISPSKLENMMQTSSLVIPSKAEGKGSAQGKLTESKPETKPNSFRKLDTAFRIEPKVSKKLEDDEVVQASESKSPSFLIHDAQHGESFDSPNERFGNYQNKLTKDKIVTQINNKRKSDEESTDLREDSTQTKSSRKRFPTDFYANSIFSVDPKAKICSSSVSPNPAAGSSKRELKSSFTTSSSVLSSSSSDMSSDDEEEDDYSSDGGDDDDDDDDNEEDEDYISDDDDRRSVSENEMEEMPKNKYEGSPQVKPVEAENEEEAASGL